MFGMTGMKKELFDPLRVVFRNFNSKNPNIHITVRQEPFHRLPDETAVKGGILVVTGKGVPGFEPGIQRQGNIFL